MIYVDVSAAVHGKAGLSRYAENLVRALVPLLGDRLGLFQNSLGKRGPLPGWEGGRIVGVRWGYKPWRAMVLARQLTHWPFANLLPEAELFHATEHLLPPLRGVPTVLTVHDLIFKRYPQYHKRANYVYLQIAMPLFCQRADAIICISENTKCDLIAEYGLPPEKIVVIPEAADPRFRPQPAKAVQQARARYGIPERYLLTVGTLEPRKNLVRLMEACGPLFERQEIDALVIVGARGWLYEGFLAHLETFPWREKVLLLGFVEDHDLPAFYTGALATVQPSLYEGFGLPVLEAMACGSPVCASNTASLPEVGGDAALYFDPTDVDAITETLTLVVTDPERQQRMRQQGLARAALFSWERTARETWAVYQRLLS